MGIKGNKNWSRTRLKNTNGQAGEFGHYLMAKILNCQLSKPGDDEHADIFSYSHQVRVEVKARSNDNAFGVGIKQLTKYHRRRFLPFPIIDTLYALVSYRGKQRVSKEKPRPRSRNLKKTKTYSQLAYLPMKFERHRFLAEHTDEIWVLDMKVIDALKKILPIRKGQFVGREEQKSIEIYRTPLRKILRDSSYESMVKQLGLNPKKWMREQRIIDSVVVVDGHEHSVKCRLIFILKKDTFERIEPAIRFRAPSGDN